MSKSTYVPFSSGEIPGNLSYEEIQQMSAEALRLHLNSFNLATAGRRPQLVERLSQHLGAVSDGPESMSEEDAPPTSRTQGPSASR